MFIPMATLRLVPQLSPLLTGPLTVLLAVLVPQGASATPPDYASGSRAFVTEMAARHGFMPAELDALMADARYQQRIIDAMNRPYEGKPWRDYRRLFVTPERIDGGVAFLRANADLLRKAESAYGVPPEVITAIIGIETNYGRTLGDHRVLDALTTLGFAYPRRAAFFRKELEEFLLLTRDEQVDARSAMGSYAGAVGKPQFIPSSYRAYAVDFDKDGRRDLWDSNADVIGSVGNYLAQHGWRRGEAIATPARLTAGPPPGIVIGEKRPVQPDTAIASLIEAGVEPAEPLPRTATAALIALDGDETEHWLTLTNFYAITRYNHSNLYALAAYQLSREIATRAAEGER